MGMLHSLPGLPVRCGRLLFMTALLGGFSADAFAVVRTSTSYRSYFVGGSSAASLVSYMHSHPFPGDHGCQRRSKNRPDGGAKVGQFSASSLREGTG